MKRLTSMITQHFFGVAAAASIIVVGIVYLCANLKLISMVNEMQSAAHDRLALYESTLNSAINKHRYLPFVISEDPRAQTVLDGSGSARELNEYLEAVNSRADSFALFVIDDTGTAVASSDRRYLGYNFGFRPYFTEAIEGKAGTFYGVGFVTGEPGYFISHPIQVHEKRVGVAVVKIDLSPLQQDWREGGETVFVTDCNGIVFLSSEQAWLYRSRQPLDPRVCEKVSSLHQYKELKHEPLVMDRKVSGDVVEMTIGGREYFVMSRYLPAFGWDMHYLMAKTPLTGLVSTATMVALSMIGVIVASFLLVRERHHKRVSRLQAEESERIREINLKLEEEIKERSRTEKMLRDTQEELIQAGKLAILGQMSATIVHELNQPISAMRMFAASTKMMLEMNRSEGARANLETISELIERMAAVTGQLKTFASKAPERLEDFDVRLPVQNALAILDHQILSGSIEVKIDFSKEPLVISADMRRLTQVFVNIIKNALDAVQNSTVKLIAISDRQVGLMAEVAIADSGSGIPSAVRERIFDPFVSTKKIGEGMGLGLSICRNIVLGFHGEIGYENAEIGGAAFTVRLPLRDHAKAS